MILSGKKHGETREAFILVATSDDTNKAACESKDDFACCDALCALSGVPIPDSIAKLPTMSVRHSTVCEKEVMAQAVLNAVK